MSFSMLASSADANTSAGAPCWIWATRSEEPAKLNSTVDAVVVGLELVGRSRSKVAVSDAAAYTVSVVAPAATVATARVVVRPARGGCEPTQQRARQRARTSAS